jgi:hypothetical protein
MDTLQILSDIYLAVLTGLFDLTAWLLQGLIVYLVVVLKWLGTATMPQYIWLALGIPSLAIAAVYLGIIYPLDKWLMERLEWRRERRALAKEMLDEEARLEQSRIVREAMQAR